MEDGEIFFHGESEYGGDCCKIKQLVMSPYTFSSTPHSFCSALEKVFLHLFRLNSYLCT